MQSSTITITAVFAFIAIGLTAGYPSVLSNSPAVNHNEFPESRNFFQQLVINQIVNVLPVNIRDKINSTATTFGMTRNEFLIRCLKELQAFQTYSKIDFITAIQKVIKFIDDEVTDEQGEQLQVLEVDGIQLATLLFANQLKPHQANRFYDLIVKVVRKQITGQALVDQLPILVHGVLAEHA